MSYVKKLSLPVIAGAVLLAGALLAPATSQAKDMQVTSRSDGGVEVKFPNGCFVAYDQYGNRGGHAGQCKNKQYERADDAAKSHLNASGNTSANSVPEGQMSRYCMGEASAELNENPRYISTQPVQRMGNKYVVYGQTPESGSNVTTFVCTFNQSGVFKGVEVTHRADNMGGSTTANSVPEGQMSRYCMGEASAELNENPRYISTQPVQRMGNKYVVYGQTPQSGSNVTTFECTFNQSGVFKGVKVTGRANDQGYGSNNNGIPRAAKKRCEDMFGGAVNFGPISPLRPGYWEVIMNAANGPRSVACTVTSNGEIEDWIELN